MPMWRCWCLVLAACSTTDSPDQPPRERDVLIDTYPGGTLIYQDGDGPWQLVPPVGDRFGFDVSADRYGVALIDVASLRVDVTYATVSERPDLLFTAPKQLPSQLASGTVSGLPSGGFVATGAKAVILPTSASQAYSLPALDSPQTIAFGRTSEAAFTPPIDSLIIRRDVVAGSGIDADFASEGIPTVEIPLNVNSHGAPGGCSLSGLFSWGGPVVPLSSTVLKLAVPPADVWRAGDRLDVSASCSFEANTSLLFQSAFAFDAIPTNLDIPGRTAHGDVTITGGRFQLSWDAPDATPFYRVSLNDSTAALRWSYELTAGWTEAASFNAGVISPPDLESLALLDPTLVLSGSVFWIFSAVEPRSNGRFEVFQTGFLDL